MERIPTSQAHAQCNYNSCNAIRRRSFVISSSNIMLGLRNIFTVLLLPMSKLETCQRNTEIQLVEFSVLAVMTSTDKNRKECTEKGISRDALSPDKIVKSVTIWPNPRDSPNCRSMEICADTQPMWTTRLVCSTKIQYHQS